MSGRGSVSRRSGAHLTWERKGTGKGFGQEQVLLILALFCCLSSLCRSISVALFISGEVDGKGKISPTVRFLPRHS